MNVGTYAFAQLLRVLPRTRITRAVGHLCDLPLHPVVSRAVVGMYARAYKVDMQEARRPNGDGSYRSFDAFFTRGLQAGSRAHEAPDNVLMSPADGRLDAHGPVDDSGCIVVKGRPYRAVDLLGSSHLRSGSEVGDSAELDRYRGGHFSVIYLSPRDYHRVHTPCAGVLSEVRSYPGELFPVNNISEQHIPQFLARNRRVALALDSPVFGRVTLVMVAAMIVGRVTVSGIDARDVPLGTHAMNDELTCGSELGMFHLGSTVVMFCEAGVPRLQHPLGPVRLGDHLLSTSRAAGDEPESVSEGNAS